MIVNHLKLDHHQAVSLSRLWMSPDGKTLKQILERELAKADTFNRTAAAEPLYRSQGRASLLAEFIQAGDNAEELAATLKS